MKIPVNSGGVWNSTEDQILKVAVTQYGKNQWDRVSAFLVDKSAKQCEARWHERLEYLLIRKSEWKTGRTPSHERLECYEELFDAASPPPACGEDIENYYEPVDDHYPNQESKPKPDPVDHMDDQEMLCEARARLANGAAAGGRKAERNRLEVEATGIDDDDILRDRKRKRKGEGVDYNDDL